MQSSKLRVLRTKIRQFELFDASGMSKELKSSLYWVIWGVTIGMLSVNVTTGAAWTGFQREVLGANDFQLGLIAAVPVAANVLQLLISFVMEKKRNRRFLFLFFGILGRSLWIVIGLLPFFIPVAQQTLRVSMTIALVMLVSTGNSFVNLGYNSLMGDLVPMRKRGGYFSARQRVSLAAGVVAGFAVSYLIDTLGTMGYSLVLVLAGISGMADICCFFFVKWPEMAKPDDGEKKQSAVTILKGVLADKEYMKLCLFFTCWQFSVGLSSPFNNVYFLEVLQLSFVEITLYTQIVSNVTTVLFVTFWGRRIDQYGNKPIIQSVGLICSLVPMLFVFMQKGSIALVIFYHFLTGLFWICIDLGQTNLYLCLSPQKNRSVYVAVFFATINLLGISLGNATGGALVQGVFQGLGEKGHMLFGIALNKYHYVYILSTVLRLLFMFALFPHVKEEDATDVKDMVRERRQNLSRLTRELKVGMLRKTAYRRLRQNEKEKENDE